MAKTQVLEADKEVPFLRGWLHAQQVADELGISRQSITRLMAEGIFRTQRAVGDRPLYVVRIEEVQRFGELRSELGSTGKAIDALQREKPKAIGLDKADRD